MCDMSWDFISSKVHKSSNSFDANWMLNLSKDRKKVKNDKSSGNIWDQNDELDSFSTKWPNQNEEECSHGWNQIERQSIERIRSPRVLKHDYERGYRGGFKRLDETLKIGMKRASHRYPERSSNSIRENVGIINFEERKEKIIQFYDEEMDKENFRFCQKIYNCIICQYYDIIKIEKPQSNIPSVGWYFYEISHNWNKLDFGKKAKLDKNVNWFLGNYEITTKNENISRNIRRRWKDFCDFLQMEDNKRHNELDNIHKKKLGQLKKFKKVYDQEREDSRHKNYMTKHSRHFEQRQKDRQSRVVHNNYGNNHYNQKYNDKAMSMNVSHNNNNNFHNPANFY